MNCTLLIRSIVLAAIIIPAATSTLHSVGNPPNCELSVECVGRLPYFEPLVLINPVAGCSPADIGSVWGDSRDDGKRTHEGIDIFAPRGTLVVAPLDGIITKVGWNALGGRVVWMSSRKTQHAFYFAHLAQYNVCKGDTVRQGQVLGTIGNTGNARFTKPHLHFGIYDINTRRAMRREIVWKNI